MPELSGDQTISEELSRQCAAEPIHIIGTVQPHGFVLVVDIDTMVIVQVSSGLDRYFAGMDAPTRPLQQPLADWVESEAAPLAALLGDLPASDPVLLPLRRRFRGARMEHPKDEIEILECVGHRVAGAAVLEWQIRGAVDWMGEDAQTLMHSALASLRRAKSLDVFLNDCVQQVARLSGFDRVMLYRFLPDWTGEVLAEQAAPHLKTRFLGLRFPASDIPAQARQLFTQSRIRVLADVDALPDALMPALLPSGQPLDQSHSLLRGLSEVHRTYLRNMGVRATMSLSIVCDEKLWGLIACHHYLPRSPPHQIRKALRNVCELVAGVSSLRIEGLVKLAAADDVMRLESLVVRCQQLVFDEDPARAIDEILPELLHTFRASAACVRIGDLRFVGGRRGAATDEEILGEIASLFGEAPAPGEVINRTDMLNASGTPVVTLPEAAGLLAVQRAADPLEIFALIRPEVVKEVAWAGAPVKTIVTAPSGQVRLEPRSSFELWKENIAGTARPWSAGESATLERLLAIFSDAFKAVVHKTLTQELRWRAHHDHLTGLLNRRSIEENLDLRLRARRYDVAVMLIDLDHFKMVNDLHGHAAGDRLLQALAGRLSAATRPADMVARVGGDEFLLLAEMSVPDSRLAGQIAQRLHAAVADPFELGGQLVRLGLSIGVALPPGHGIVATDLMRRADHALYRAKRTGRASTVIFDTDMEEGIHDQYAMERDLQEAIGKKQLALAFQPEIDLVSGRVIGFEALLRWTHPVRGTVGPSVFIPLAERSELINHLGEWVLRSALGTQATWRTEGRDPLPIAVNVSMTEVASGRLLPTIKRLLAEYALPPQCLAIELTESVIMQDLKLALSVLGDLRELGISAALDDFGTGYSSLSYLRQLPLTMLKVDQSFTAELTTNAHSQSLTQAIIRMADALNMTTIAEGVETVGQLNWLRKHRCRIGQGYLFSPAVEAGQAHATLAHIEEVWGRLQ
jgi:diguanylate cyclase (GGDEF)-like protein